MHHVLVIDDQKTVTETLRQGLTELGFLVQTASGGREGIYLFENADFDLVITDMVMPDLDGHAVIKYIRNSGKSHTPIIGISGTPWLFEDERVDMVIPKPFTLRTLSDALQELRTHQLAANQVFDKTAFA